MFGKYKRLWKKRAIRSSYDAVIIGGGFIGLEFACFFAEIGASVTVVEMLPEIGAEPKLFPDLKIRGI